LLEKQIHFGETFVEKTARKSEMLLCGERVRMIALRDWAGQKSIPSLCQKPNSAFIF
jgi:hypothetical protein